MNRKTHTLALSGAIACLSFIPPAAADVTYYEGTREALREFCRAQHGQIVETNSKTRCNTVAGVIIICRTNGICQRQDSITVLSQESGSGGSSGGFFTAAPPMIEKLHAL